MSSFGHHHASRKLHKHKKLNSLWLTLVDKSIYIIAIVAVLANVPQLMNIWVGKNLAGVSLLSWVGFLIGSLFWLWYGVLHKERPIVITNFLLILVQSGIVLGLLFK
ncbi:MAG TPA: SemiSWEET family transporter [Patescibacteria group bacterium]